MEKVGSELLKITKEGGGKRYVERTINKERNRKINLKKRDSRTERTKQENNTCILIWWPSEANFT